LTGSQPAAPRRGGRKSFISPATCGSSIGRAAGSKSEAAPSWGRASHRRTGRRPPPPCRSIAASPKMLGFLAATPHLPGARGARGAAVCRRPRAAPAMRADGSGKKVTRLQFATDMKGGAVWALREGRPDDVDALVALGGDVGRQGAAVIAALVAGGDGGCVVCEASVKGGKAGDGYTGRVLGAVLADVTMAVRDPAVGFESGLVKRAEVLACTVAPAMMDADAVAKTLLVASLKRLKTAGVSMVTRSIADGDVDGLQACRDIGFKVARQSATEVKGSKVKRTILSAALATINPDPKKRFS
jgi:hypothetical protein